MFSFMIDCTSVVFVDGSSWESQENERDLRCVALSPELVKIMYSVSGKQQQALVPLTSIVRFENAIDVED